MSRTRVCLVLAGVLVAGLLPQAPSSAAPPAMAPGGVLRGDLGPAGAEPLVMAERVLRRHASRLGVDADDFRFETVRRSIVGIHVRGREFRGGVPVEGSYAAVHAVDGRVWQVEARASSLPGTATPSPVSAAAATAAGLGRIGVRDPLRPATAERVLLPRGGRLTDAWLVRGASLRPPVFATVVIDAATGGAIEIRDERRFAEGMASLFDPSPMVTARDPDLRQPGPDVAGVDTDGNSGALNAQLKLRLVRQFDTDALDFGRLTGPWADVQGPLPLDRDGEFRYTRSDPRFEAVMAYFHIDRFQRYLIGLGFRGSAAVNAEPQAVIAIPVPGFDNSFYAPDEDLILYGNGGVDDAEDAEIVLHEYGHAIQHAQVAGFGRSHEGGAMGEGFGDFVGAAYYAIRSGGFGDRCVGEWDATSYSDTDPPCLRRLDTGKRYPQDLDHPEDPLTGEEIEDEPGSIHADGEIWSQFLWHVRDLLGCVPGERGCARRSRAATASVKTARVLKLVLASHEFLSPDADFGDAVAALRTAARALKQPRWVPLITRAARARGLPLS